MWEGRYWSYNEWKVDYSQPVEMDFQRRAGRIKQGRERFVGDGSGENR